MKFELTEEQNCIVKKALADFKKSLANAGLQIIVGVDLDYENTTKTELMVAPTNVIVKDDRVCTNEENENCYLSFDLPKLDLGVQEYYPESTSLVITKKSEQRVAYDIDWDTDGDIVDLPTKVDLPSDIADDDIANYLSDKYDFCVFSYKVK